jgi:hypothetical protein
MTRRQCVAAFFTEANAWHRRQSGNALPGRPEWDRGVGHLDSLTGILKEMGCVYREMRQGTTKIADGTRLVYSLRCMRDVLETIAVERLEDRLDELEGGRGEPKPN